MTPEESASLLAAADASELEQLADEILAGAARTSGLAGPEVVSTPLRLPSNTGELVVIGHVTLTTCRIELDGVRGDGLRPGRDLVGALAAAVCDAEITRGGRQADRVVQLCARTAEARRAELDQLARLVASTRIGAQA